MPHTLQSTHEFWDPYFSFKVSLSDVPIDEVIQSLTSLISSKIILHNINIAQDIQYITTRNDVEKGLIMRGLYSQLYYIYN